MPETMQTALDHHAANLAAVLGSIEADPQGTVARTVRDDLRRAHERGVQRNFHAVTQLVRALPRQYWVGLVSPRCRNRAAYRQMLAA